MGGLREVGQPRNGCLSGVSSTRRAVRPTATGIRALILGRSASGGIARVPIDK